MRSARIAGGRSWGHPQACVAEMQLGRPGCLLGIRLNRLAGTPARKGADLACVTVERDVRIEELTSLFKIWIINSIGQYYDPIIMEDISGYHYTFRPAQLLGQPSVIAPQMSGKISVSLQFIIPDLQIAKNEIDSYKKLITSCVDEVWGSDILNVNSAALITIAFYIEYIQDGNELHNAIENKSRIIIERFLGVVSYCAGIKIRAVNIVTTRREGSNLVATLNAIDKAQFPKVEFTLPQKIYEDEILTDEILTALFWLRRGLAENDPIDTFNALMVCLQVLARNWWELHKTEGETLPTPTILFRDYLIREIGADPSQIKNAWKKRNGIAAHGNKLNIDANDFVGLIELKFKAIGWAYKGINLSLGLDLRNAPRPSQNLFMTPALMNLD